MNNVYSTLLKKREKLEQEWLGFLYVRANNSQLVESIGIIPSLDTFQTHFEILIAGKLQGKDMVELCMEKDIYLSFFLEDGWRSGKDITNDLVAVRKTIQAIKVLQHGVESITEENVEEKTGEVQIAIASLGMTGTREEIDIKPILKAYEGVVERNKTRSGLLGYDTGIKRVNEAIDGLRPPHIFVVAGYTSLGKSYFALNITSKCLEQNARVAFYSLEMSKIDLVSRLLSISTNITGHAIVHGADVSAAKQKLGDSNLRLINEKRSLKELVLSLNEQKLAWKADVAVIDYIQNVDVPGAKGDYERMSQVSSEMQRLAGHLNIPIILVSQVSNDAARSPTSSVMGFKGSGTIASVADFAIELVSAEPDVKTYRDKVMSNQPVQVNAIIKKNRHGAVGTIPLVFHGSTGRFIEQEDEFDMSAFTKAQPQKSFD